MRRQADWWSQARDWAGAALPAAVQARIARAEARLAILLEQVTAVEAVQAERTRVSAPATARHRLVQLRGVATTSAAIITKTTKIIKILVRLGELRVLRDLCAGVCAVGCHSLLSAFRTASRTPLISGTGSSPLNVRASSSASLMITLAGVSGSVSSS